MNCLKQRIIEHSILSLHRYEKIRSYAFSSVRSFPREKFAQHEECILSLDHSAKGISVRCCRKSIKSKSCQIYYYFYGGESFVVFVRNS